MSKSIKEHTGLASLHSDLGKFAFTIRNRIQNDCGWSEATFYRKLRTNSAYTPAEFQAIKKCILNEIEIIMATLNKIEFGETSNEVLGMKKEEEENNSGSDLHKISLPGAAQLPNG